MFKLNSFGLGIAVVVVFVFTLMSAQALMIAPSPKTIYVPDNYSTIQQAVDSASPGDTIIVRDGTYIENVYIDKPYLTIESENGSTNCIVEAANSSNPVIEVTASYVSITGFTVRKGSIGIYLNHTSYCNISKNNCSNNGNGILLWYSNNSNITNNIGSKNSQSTICLSVSNDNVISSNICKDSFTNIGLSYSNNNKIENNNCSNTNIQGCWPYYSIYLSHSNNNLITNNKYFDNIYGIYLFESSYNKIIGNEIFKNTEGLSTRWKSMSNEISRNTFFDNSIGLYLHDVCYMVCPIRNNNIIYLNSFINNTDNARSLASENIWRSTEPMLYTYNGKTYKSYLGNYWDDYIGSDTDGDGIGDYPYVIYSDNQDNYPLMKPIENYKIIEKWSFAIITDLHVGYGIPDFGTDGWDDTLTGNPALDNYYLTKRLEAVVDWINNHIDDYNIKFVAVLGDITDTAEKSEFIKAKEILDKLDVPYFPIIGNHDVCPYIQQAGHHPDYRIRYGKQGEISRKHFRNIFTNDFFKTQANKLGVVINFQSEDSDDLLNYAFTYRGIKFVFLDFASDEYAAGYHSGIEGEAKLFHENLDWLREQTSGSTPVVLFSHYPMATFRDVSPYFYLTDMHPTITFALINGAFSVDEITAIGKELLGKKILANFAGHIHSCSLGGLIPMEFNANRVYGYLCGAPVISTEAILAESSEVIRIVQIEGDSITNYNILKPEKGELTSAINPWITFNPKNIDAWTEVEFEAGAKPWLFGISYEWDLDGDGETDSTDDDPEFVYSEPGTYYVFLTIEDDGNRETVWQRITVHPYQIPAWVIEAGVEAAELYFTLAFEEDVDLTEVAQNTFELVRVFVRHSEARPVAEMAIHFENATEDINLTNLIADTNITQRKSILYMPEWPEVIEESKILYIPSTGKGAVYICKNATSLDEVSMECSDFVINVGETLNGISVLPTYYNDTEYYMVLNITGTGGGEAPSQHPYASFTYSPEYPIVNEKIIFNASSSYDPDGNITKYEWDFGDGNITEVEEPVITHTYSIAGNYTVKLTVTDDKGMKSSISRNITVRPVINQPPIANANGPYAGIEGQPVEFNASASYDPEGVNLTYYWEFGDGETAVTTQPTITHIYAQEGNYTVTLIVNDSVQNSTPSITYALINDTEPKANFTANITSGFAPLTVQFNDSSVSYDGIIAWEWDFDGDGIVDSNEQNPIYTYDEAGTYTVSLTVYEADGDSDTETKTDYITVTSAVDTEPPTIESVTLDTYINIPNSSFHVTVEATDNVGVTAVTADGVTLTKTGSRWEGDIFIPEGTPEGEYTLTITAKDEAGNTAESSVNYSVVFPQGGFTVAIDPMMSSASAGDVKVYQIKIISNENFDDKLHVYISDEGIPDAYKANFSFNWTDKTIYLKSGETVELSLEVTIPQASGYKMFRVYADSMRFRTSGYCTGIVLIS